MVHLATVQPKPEAAATAGEGEERQFSTTVYGSKEAARDLPSHEMREEEMDPRIAYRLIHDELALDGNPFLNLASFVTTYMEPEAEKLMADGMATNFIDAEEYPATTDIQNRCVSMIARLFNVPEPEEGKEPLGVSTVGSSEAIMLATLAMKRRWQDKRKAEGKDWHSPNLIMSSAVQVCWEKAVGYFEIEPRYVNVTKDMFELDPQKAVDLVDENTIGICAILGVTYHGAYEDVKKIDELLRAKNEKLGLQVPIHVDAASGGFVAPFVYPELEWDFRIPSVVSINVSGHKYGLTFPGIGWAVWRSPDFLPKSLVYNLNYLGSDQASFTLNFSKGASQVLAQYYQLVRLGKSGYRAIMQNLTADAVYLSDKLSAADGGNTWKLMSKRGKYGLPLVAFHLTAKRHYDEFDVARELRQRQWIVPAYTMAPDAGDLKMLRIVLREDFSRSRCDLFLRDLKAALDHLDSLTPKEVESTRSAAKSRAASGPHAKNAKHGKNSAHHKHKEGHSLQAKHGKTHGVC